MGKNIEEMEMMDTMMTEVENDLNEDTVESEDESLRIKGYKGPIITSPTKAIKAHCIECCGGSAAEAKQCTATKCPLWCFRTGKNPYRHRTMSEEQKAALGERLLKARGISKAQKDAATERLVKASDMSEGQKKAAADRLLKAAT